jgi:sec-independent protein translocase protein TatA
MLGIGAGELLIILVILLLLFGAAKLPKLAKSIGEAGGELRKGFEGGIDDKNSKNKTTADKNNNSN